MNKFLGTIIDFIYRITKIKFLSTKRESIIQFIKFGLVGVSNTAIHYVIYAIMILLGVNMIVSNTVAFLISVLNSFYWNNKYVFRKNEGEKRNWVLALFKTYLSYGFTGIILNNLLLLLWVNVLNIPELVAPVLNWVVTIPLNFIINKFWAFSTKKRIKNEEQK